MRSSRRYVGNFVLRVRSCGESKRWFVGGFFQMSDHQDRAKHLPERDSGRLHHHPRSDLEHAAQQLLTQCEAVEFPSANLTLAMDNLRAVLGGS
jgi:hypothetical protein